jgi:hypothetical protein
VKNISNLKNLINNAALLFRAACLGLPLASLRFGEAGQGKTGLSRLVARLASLAEAGRDKADSLAAKSLAG